MLRLLISVSGVVLGYITASCFYVYTPQIGKFIFYNVIPWGIALYTFYVYGSAFLQEFSDPVTVTVAQSLSQAQILYAQLYAELLPNVGYGYEFLAKFQESGSNISSSTGGNGGNVKYFIIPSILENKSLRNDPKLGDYFKCINSSTYGYSNLYRIAQIIS